MSVVATQLVAQGSPKAFGNDRLIPFSLAVSDTPAATVGAGAGTGGTATLANGSNSLRGRITIVTGTSASAAALATIALGHTLASAPRVQLTPGNAAAANLADQRVSASSTTTVITITANGSALADSTTYIWDYEVVGAEVSVDLQAQGLYAVEYVLSTTMDVNSISLSGNTATLKVVPKVSPNSASIGGVGSGYATLVGTV